MVLWIENTSGVSGSVDLIGLRITGGRYSTSASTTAGGMLILNTDVVLKNCEVSFNTGSTSHPAGSAAGGIFISGGRSVELYEVSFSDNFATSLAAAGRDIFGDDGSVVSHGCYFADADADAENAPNIYLKAVKMTFKSSCEAGFVGAPLSLELPTLEGGWIVGTIASYAQNVSSCIACDPYYFSSQFAQHCSLCPPSKSSNAAASSCFCAPPFADSEASEGECECGAGYYFNDNACSRCDNGFFKSEVGNGACDRCDFAVTGSTATKGIVLPTSNESCICWVGEVLETGTDGGKRCLSCPVEGTDCMSERRTKRAPSEARPL